MGRWSIELNPIHITARVTAVLEELGVSYFIAGSLASTFHGMIRTTQDSDLVAKFGLDHTKPFVISLGEEFYIDQEMIVNAITNQSSFNIIHRESLFKVDIFIPRLGSFENEQFNRTQRQVLSLEPKVEAFVASAEDTLLAKLKWYRMGGEVSERQWRDVIGMVKVQGSTLDMRYLTRMADELQVRDLLDKAVADQ
jgi:hypothetical protein